MGSAGGRGEQVGRGNERWAVQEGEESKGEERWTVQEGEESRDEVRRVKRQ